MKRIRRCLTVLAVVAGAMPLAAQIIPSAPVVNFRLPMFNSEGFKTWELRGSEGRYVDENRVEITAVNLKVFSGDASNILQTEITSPLAIVQIKERIVRGPGTLRVIGPGYEMYGEDWIYEDAKKSIVVQREVVVTFQASVGNILK